MRKRLIPLILLLILAGVAVAYSVLISLASTDIDQLGATDKVNVQCPASGTPCKIDKVGWLLTTAAPYKVDKVRVTWTPAKSDASVTYHVYVELYDDSESLISSGSATQAGSSTPVITTVDVVDVDPEDIYEVRIVIMEG